LQLSAGFFTGIGLAFLSITIGVIGAILLTQSRSGFQGEMRSRELLVSYHDRLRELRALPDDSEAGQKSPPSTGFASRVPPSAR
jgi:ABC-type lipoprotein release transport system permease subunit